MEKIFEFIDIKLDKGLVVLKCIYETINSWINNDALLIYDLAALYNKIYQENLNEKEEEEFAYC